MFLLKLQTAKTSPLYPISALCVHSVLKWAAGFVFQKCLCSDSLHIDGFFCKVNRSCALNIQKGFIKYAHPFVSPRSVHYHQVCTSVCQPKVGTLSSSIHIRVLAQGRYIIIKYAHPFVSPRSVHYHQVCTSICQPKVGTLSSSMHIHLLAQDRYIIIQYAHLFVSPRSEHYHQVCTSVCIHPVDFFQFLYGYRIFLFVRFSDWILDLFPQCSIFCAFPDIHMVLKIKINESDLMPFLR